MQLTEEQQKTVVGWAREGLGLSDIQKRLSAEFGLRATYMDVRVMALELGLPIQDKTIIPRSPAPPRREASDPSLGAAAGDDDNPHGGAGGVRVEVDRIVKAGAVLSGTVRFSDGDTAGWALDQFGRLGLEPTRAGRKPSAADLAAFQSEIRRVLSSKGF